MFRQEMNMRVSGKEAKEEIRWRRVRYREAGDGSEGLEESGVLWRMNFSREMVKSIGRGDVTES